MENTQESKVAELIKAIEKECEKRGLNPPKEVKRDTHFTTVSKTSTKK